MKKTLTIGIIAFNEAGSIKQLLLGLKKQKITSCTLEKVLVISDASTDATVEKVKEVAWNKVSVVLGKTRHGKPYRLNGLFKDVTSDILISIDADVVLTDNSFIEKMANAVIKSHQFISSNATPLRGKTFSEKAINNFYTAREVCRETFDYSLKAGGYRGTALGYSRHFYKSVKLPLGIMNDDTYMFFFAKRLQVKTKQVKNARAYFKSPDNKGDFIRQMVRYIKGEEQLKSYFSPEEMSFGTNLPKKFLLKISLYQFIRSPFGYIYLKMLLYLARTRASKSSKMNVQWLMVASSKFVGTEIQI